MCQKYKKKKEEADEVAELDRSNIIASGQLCAAQGNCILKYFKMVCGWPPIMVFIFAVI